MLQSVFPSLAALGAGLLLAVLPVRASAPAAPARLVAGQPARAFALADVTGQPVSLATLRGHKVLLAFMRNAGCPVCNLRMHQLLEQADYFKAHNLTVVAVYESPAERLRQYLTDQPSPFVVVPNPDQSLYQLYALEVSGGKAMKSVFHGVMGKAKAGQKLMAHPLAQDGNKSRIGADFLLDEQGKVAVAHYDRYIGDELPLADIRRFAQ